MAQWIRRRPPEPEIPGSSPGRISMLHKITTISDKMFVPWLSCDRMMAHAQSTCVCRIMNEQCLQAVVRFGRASVLQLAPRMWRSWAQYAQLAAHVFMASSCRIPTEVALFKFVLGKTRIPYADSYGRMCAHACMHVCCNRSTVHLRSLWNLQPGNIFCIRDA